MCVCVSYRKMINSYIDREIGRQIDTDGERKKSNIVFEGKTVFVIVSL